jgi:NADP-dependent 3-hydroxy acid dehydrogenase YdfG
VLPQMIEQGIGSIINIASTHSSTSFPVASRTRWPSTACSA